MYTKVDVMVEGDERPPAGAPVRVEARDTSRADAPSVTVAAGEGEVRGRQGGWVETVEVNIPDRGDDCTIWAHIDVDRDGQVSRGDYVTMAAYPVPSGQSARLSIRVRKV